MQERLYRPLPVLGWEEAGADGDGYVVNLGDDWFQDPAEFVNAAFDLGLRWVMGRVSSKSRALFSLVKGM
jgi:hypothetical protein